MPLPKPRASEPENEFVSRCVAFVKEEDPNTPNSNAVAMCKNQYVKSESMTLTNQHFNFSIPIEESLSKTNELVIKGTAINSGTTRNQTIFTKEELEASGSGLTGKPLLKDHENSVDNIVGKVNTSYYDMSSESVKFEALVLDDGMIKKIKAGLVNAVSIGADCKSVEEVYSESEDGERKFMGYKVMGIDFVELSLVAVPADPHAGFGLNYAIAEAFKKCESEKNVLMEKKMAEESKIETLQAENSKLQEELLELKNEKLLAEKARIKQELEEAEAEEVVEEPEEEEKVDEKVESEEEEKVPVEDETKGEVQNEEESETVASEHYDVKNGEYGGVSIECSVLAKHE